MMRARWFSVGLITIAFVASQGNLLRIILLLEPSILALQLAFTPETFARVVTAWGPEGLARYRAHFLFDFVHPLIYAGFGWIWVRHTALFAWTWPSTRYALGLALPVAGLCDVVENLLHWRLLDLFPDVTPTAVFLSACLSSLKWSLASFFACAMALNVYRWLRRRDVKAP